ncbi:hypothetical protein D623_10029370 [Myotis brandtii]|uniref:Uncharacterized protein n=1 Tax=Myotis brandtii TaxID=109478 RepID=S7MK81_MYOBR|nr:hypothetical protein D623_10029370 [Myotis brandtii]
MGWAATDSALIPGDSCVESSSAKTILCFGERRRRKTQQSVLLPKADQGRPQEPRTQEVIRGLLNGEQHWPVRPGGGSEESELPALGSNSRQLPFSGTFSALGGRHANPQIRDCDRPNLCYVGPVTGYHMKTKGKGWDSLLRNQGEGSRGCGSWMGMLSRQKRTMSPARVPQPSSGLVLPAPGRCSSPRVMGFNKDLSDSQVRGLCLSRPPLLWASLFWSCNFGREESWVWAGRGAQAGVGYGSRFLLCFQGSAGLCAGAST